MENMENTENMEDTELNEVDYKGLGMRVRRLRVSLGITQDALARDVGICPSYLGHMERGSRKLSMDVFVALCNRLSVSPEYLLADSLDSASFPTSTKLTSRQMAALNEIYRVIERTMLDWNDCGDQERKDASGEIENE